MNKKLGFIIDSYQVIHVVLLFFCFSNCFAQLTLNTSPTPTAVVSSFSGAGNRIKNTTIICPSGGVATFVSVGGIGLSDGLLLTTGQANLAPGVNNSPSAGFNNGAPGDLDLDNLLNQIQALPLNSTYDGCAVEFDYISACNKLEIDFLLASEEYPEYVGRNFTDFAAFFVTGPDPLGGNYNKKNIALIPGTNTPAAVSTINSANNAGYFVDNAGGGTNIQYDGYTIPMKAEVDIVQCAEYHVKLVIADVLDGIFDSGVFLKARDCPDPNLPNTSPYIGNTVKVDAIRNCQNGSITFTKFGDITQPLIINYTVTGTAIAGTDYQALSGIAAIPANQNTLAVPVVINNNTYTGGNKTIQITYQEGFCSQPKTITIDIIDPQPIYAGPDVILCSGDNAAIGLPQNIPGAIYTWNPPLGITVVNTPNTLISLTNNTNNDVVTQYSLEAVVNYLGVPCMVQDNVSVTVKPLPSVNLNIANDFCESQTITYVNNSVATPGKVISTWYWNFGNNLVSNLQNPVFSYATAGNYSITLTATDNDGCSDSKLVNITVWAKPTTSFNIVNNCIQNNVDFVSTSNVVGDAIAQLTWNFGDGTNGNNSPIQHIYLGVNTAYTVSLTAISTHGCTNSVNTPLFLYPKPIVDFNFAVTQQFCESQDILFANISNGNTHDWDFGDGTNSTDRNPVHQYNLPGVYNVTLKNTTSFGCFDIKQKQITIYDNAKVDFVASVTSGCEEAFCPKFMANVLPGSDAIAIWQWSFGNALNSTGIGQTLNFCYQESGNFSPALIATTINGCTDTLTKPLYINVYSSPVADFLYTPTEIDPLIPNVELQDQSSSNVIKWHWNFGDGTEFIGENPPEHNYSISGSDELFNVRLTVIDNNGCTTFRERPILIKGDGSVFIPNTFTPNEDGLNDIFKPVVTGYYETASSEINIFNRWGKLIYRYDDATKGWDGMYKGDAMKSDVYTYTIIFYNEDDHELLKKFIGEVILLK